MIEVILQTWIGLTATVALGAAACLAVELLYNSANPPSLGSILRGFAFWSISLLTAAFGLVASQMAIRWLGLNPLINIDLSSIAGEWHWLLRLAVVVPLALLPALIYDFCYYWYHRLQHAVPVLWRFHSVHHAIEELNGTNCYHHVTEGLLKPALLLVPLFVLIQLKTPEIALISTLVNWWTLAVHINARIDFGPLKYVFVSPVFHRVHHSLDSRHFDKNFAGLFSITDVLFGTACFVSGRDTIKTGLKMKHESTTLGEFVLNLKDR